MESALLTFIEKMPVLYLALFVPAVLSGSVWVFSKLKRDKQGKLYWYSNSYELIKNNRKMDGVIESISSVKLEVCRANVYIETMPLEERMASGIRYILSGGNGATKHFIEDELRPLNPILYDGLKKILEDKK